MRNLLHILKPLLSRKRPLKHTKQIKTKACRFLDECFFMPLKTSNPPKPPTATNLVLAGLLCSEVSSSLTVKTVWPLLSVMSNASPPEEPEPSQGHKNQVADHLAGSKNDAEGFVAFHELSVLHESEKGFCGEAGTSWRSCNTFNDADEVI